MCSCCSVSLFMRGSRIKCGMKRLLVASVFIFLRVEAFARRVNRDTGISVMCLMRMG